MPLARQECKALVLANLHVIQKSLNDVLNGNHLQEISTVLMRINRSRVLPAWFETLENEHRLPNLDGKTVGSVIEKLLVCVLEMYVFNSEIQLSINPARGVDIPEIELGVKSPSTNFDTSEPYFSAYDRLLGNEYDALILLTNYQEAKNINPFQLQILEIKYLNGSEISDSNLCKLAKSLREKYDDELMLQKIVRFLAFVNQSDWEAKWILKIIREVLINGIDLQILIQGIMSDFQFKNAENQRKASIMIPEESLNRLTRISEITPHIQGVIRAVDDWVILNQKESGRYPNDNEWHRFLSSPLNGKISMSFALQWRYNFRMLFTNTPSED